MEDAKFSKLIDLIIKIKEDVGDLKAETARNTVTLEEHEKRSTASEKRLDMLEKRDQMLNGFWKISIGVLGAVGTVVAIVAAIHSLR